MRARSDHVQAVYDAVASQWHGTRYKAWPRVERFIHELPPSALVADLGCGNGKMAPASQAAGHYAIGCDFSFELTRIAGLQMGLQAQAADVMLLPYRSGVYDAALSIAVLHHVSTAARRRLLVLETLRVLRQGGLALFYAWAAEQSEGRSGHAFDASDVFVAFHNRVPPSDKGKRTARAGGAQGGSSGQHEAGSDGESCGASMAASAADGIPAAADGIPALEARGGTYDAAKNAVVFQRYCHVYREGELRELILSVGGADVLDEYYDTGNWCILVRKQHYNGGASSAADPDNDAAGATHATSALRLS